MSRQYPMTLRELLWTSPSPVLTPTSTSPMDPVAWLSCASQGPRPTLSSSPCTAAEVGAFRHPPPAGWEPAGGGRSRPTAGARPLPGWPEHVLEISPTTMPKMRPHAYDWCIRCADASPPSALRTEPAEKHFPRPAASAKPNVPWPPVNTVQ